MNRTYQAPRLTVSILDLGIYGDYGNGNDGGQDPTGGTWNENPNPFGCWWWV